MNTVSGQIYDPYVGWRYADEHVMCRRAEAAIAAFGSGSPVVVLDSEDRENEGDIIVAADHATARVVNFMITSGRGLLCVALTRARATELDLPSMVARNEDDLGTAFTVSVDAAPHHGVTTGISATDRSRTIDVLAHGDADDLRRPGHVFPIVARDGGLRERKGHTEATVELARLAGLPPIGVMIEILRPNGEAARLDDLLAFGRDHQLALTTTDDLTWYVSHARTGRSG
jgi:3,4-dihydroxy 2-butanone 4-phosphate synthase/GTP cyclohydrolase II